MTKEELAASIDLTLLRPDAAKKDIERLIIRALPFPFAAVCIAPCHAAFAAALLRNSPIKVCTVTGFPLGYSEPAVKLLEAVRAFESGAKEIDVVMNLSYFKSAEFKPAEDEISSIVKALPDATIKVIIETCYLTLEEKKRACGLVIDSGAHFVKTSTGFGTGGAKIEDIRLLSELSAGMIKIKAAGGIKTLKATLLMLEAGAHRIGTSSGIEIMEEFSSGI
ncbi:MAG: deoxyribose-phosphate aldolase [Deltaproteobacteria bacterium]|nr:deoxyribose-phosphate aldolase [Deltaproteobacteria bacterium]